MSSCTDAPHSLVVESFDTCVRKWPPCYALISTGRFEGRSMRDHQNGPLERCHLRVPEFAQGWVNEKHWHEILDASRRVQGRSSCVLIEGVSSLPRQTTPALTPVMPHKL